MKEIPLEDFENFYKERLNTEFFKIKRVSKKLITDIRDNLIQIKICMDHFQDSAAQKIDEKSRRSLNLFYERIKTSLEEIKIPENDNDINFSNLNDLTNNIKKLFTTINEIARKSLPKFQKQVQPEIKELNYFTRKLGKKQTILDQFLRKKYGDVRSAEDLLNKLPKFYNLKENIENAKKDIDGLEKDLKEKREILENLNSDLINMQKNELFKELEQKKDEIFQLRIKIDDQLGFKKALNKFKFELENNSIYIPNFNLNYLKEFLKKPISVLLEESQDLPKFTALLVQLRRILEENKLNLKTDTKEKTIEQINTIFNQKLIQSDLTTLKNLNENVNEIENKIQKAGLSQKLDDIKNQISINTVKLEHIETDFDRRNKDYLRYLGTLKQEREEFQKVIESVIHEDVKINISFEF
jgi:hypothetical protein